MSDSTSCIFPQNEPLAQALIWHHFLDASYLFALMVCRPFAGKCSKTKIASFPKLELLLQPECIQALHTLTHIW